MQRIIAGSQRGRRLLELPRSITDVRPTASRVRGAIFDRLQAEVAEAHVLDLFAGTGALSLEALSRGARRATLVEAHRSVASFLARQVETLRFADRCDVVCGDACEFLARPSAHRYDLVFVDPPYADHDLYARVAAGLLASGCLADDAVVVFERDTVRSRAAVEACPPGFQLDARRRYGQTAVDFLSVAGP